MATKKQTRTGDRSRRVMTTLTARFRPHEQFHADVEVPGLTPKQVGSALAMLAKKGLVQHGALRGYYCLPNGVVQDSEVVVIDNLLAAMAAAEPILRKHKKVIALMQEFR